ncbi:MAG: fumarate reductase/succinate dehydrogenase flavoprotein subunit [Bdellovibrionales bacterium]|nr:fumarate reductase/succinate dehydrogenase flavoprotein subunit [Oligoflexia bacterium]
MSDELQNKGSSDSLDSGVPSGALDKKWESYKANMKLVNPANKRKYSVIVVGTGLAGASAAASLAELGYNVKSFCIHGSARRAHSIAAQGGINAAKSYPNDGDSVWRLFYDTIKGGDYRAREANVYRLAQNSTSIIDQMVAQGVPFAREYSGELANRSFGGAQVSRTFYARGQTGQQLLLGAYSQMMKEVDRGKIEFFGTREMLDVVMVDGKARGIIVRNLNTGEIERHAADVVILATGGYGRVYYLSTNAMNSNVTATWRAHRKGAYFANPCYVQIHPTCIPVSGTHQAKLTLMSESLRNDGRVWVPKKKEDCKKDPNAIADEDRDYFLERKYPSFGNLVPRDVASRNAKELCDEGLGVGETGLAVYLDFRDVIKRDGEASVREKYGNLFDMYHEITSENPYHAPMRIYPAVHYTMGGLWVDYSLQTNLQGLFCAGEANFSDHGANRLGASALMQGLSDGYFVLPYTVTNYIGSNAQELLTKVEVDHPEFVKAETAVREEINSLLARGKKGKHTPNEIFRELGLVVWDKIGMARSKESLTEALAQIKVLQDRFDNDLLITGDAEKNQHIETAGRVKDFLELGALMATDALQRAESCGGHFRVESATPEGEAKRDDENYAYVSAWEHKGKGVEPELHKEPLIFENVKLSVRSYK